MAMHEHFADARPFDAHRLDIAPADDAPNPAYAYAHSTCQSQSLR